MADMSSLMSASFFEQSHPVAHLGQVFTRDDIVARMLALRRNTGRVLEPSAGDGAFARHIPGCVAVELDARVAPARAADGPKAIVEKAMQRMGGTLDLANASDGGLAAHRADLREGEGPGDFHVVEIAGLEAGLRDRSAFTVRRAQIVLRSAAGQPPRAIATARSMAR